MHYICYYVRFRFVFQTLSSIVLEQETICFICVLLAYSELVGVFVMVSIKDSLKFCICL